MSERMVLDVRGNALVEIDARAKEQEVKRTVFVKRAIATYLILLKELDGGDRRRLAIVEGDKIIERFILP